MDGEIFHSAHRVAVLAGGESAEREISLQSGCEAAAALAVAGYAQTVIDPFESEIDSLDWSTFDLAFIALHGGAGEDGRIQAALEPKHIPFTGCGPRASRLAMDKAAAKREFLRRGVPTPPFALLARGVKFDVAELGYPLVIKPNSQGSSLGVSVVNRPEDVPSCLAIARQLDASVLVERFIEGREFTIAILGHKALPLVEIVHPSRELFDYEAKYLTSTTECRLDTNLPAGVAAKLCNAALAAAGALKTSGLIRVDLILDRENQPWVLEVNTVPGMTTHSLAPLAARAAGMEMPALVDWMVRDAIERRPTMRKRQSATTRMQGVRA
jgi:D-alanine-D-alanine ligase